VKQRLHLFRWTALIVWVAAGVIPAARAQDSEQADSLPKYPLAVAVASERLLVVDLDLPGVWAVDPERQLMVQGSNLLRQPMNRPRCIVILPDGAALVGDSATREVYRIDAGSDPKPLTDGYIGIPMAMAVDPEGKMVYVGDAEKRATFRVPIDGGKPELVARVNARGLAFDGDGNLWAVTPDDAAIQKINVQTNEVEQVITGRPYQYPNGLAWAGDHGYVTDGYGKAIWKFTADGKTEKWHEGAPLVGPVGIAVDATNVYVADPKQKQVYQFHRETKEVTERL
jgi:sugar lactone lactonase YvrE